MSLSNKGELPFDVYARRFIQGCNVRILVSLSVVRTSANVIRYFLGLDVTKERTLLYSVYSLDRSGSKPLLDW